MKNILSIITRFALAAGSVLMMASCEDYLDKNPESNVNKEDAFKNFNNFQGYIEEIYNCIPDKAKCNWTTSWNLGDDEIQNPHADNRMNHQIDIGNFYAWQTDNYFGLVRAISIALLRVALIMDSTATLGIVFQK